VVCIEGKAEKHIKIILLYTQMRNDLKHIQHLTIFNRKTETEKNKHQQISRDIEYLRIFTYFLFFSWREAVLFTNLRSSA